VVGVFCSAPRQRTRANSHTNFCHLLSIYKNWISFPFFHSDLERCLTRLRQLVDTLISSMLICISAVATPLQHYLTCRRTFNSEIRSSARISITLGNTYTLSVKPPSLDLPIYSHARCGSPPTSISSRLR